MDLSAAFTPEQVAWRSRANATALILGTIAMLKRRSMDAETWFREQRLLFRASWQALEGQGARTIMTLFVLNPVSVGATLLALAGDDEQAEGVISDWPPADMLQMLDLTDADLDPSWNALGVSAEDYSFQYTWWRAEHGAIHLSLRRES